MTTITATTSAPAVETAEKVETSPAPSKAARIQPRTSIRAGAAAVPPCSACNCSYRPPR